MILYPATSTHNHSASDCSGDWSTSDHSNRSWTHVARPWFLLRIDPASEKLGITSLSAVVRWVSCRTMMKAAFLLPRPEKDVVWPIPRWTHLARVAVVALMMTDLVSISGNAATGRATWRHLSFSSYAVYSTNRIVFAKYGSQWRIKVVKGSLLKVRKGPFLTTRHYTFYRLRDWGPLNGGVPGCSPVIPP